MCHRIQALSSKKGVQGGDIDKLVALENSNRMGDKEIQDYLIKRRGYMEVLFKSWNDTPIVKLPPFLGQVVMPRLW
jgi:hypothetical protein